MSQQDKQEINNHESLIEDLTVNQEQEEEVRGGTGWGSSAYQYGFTGNYTNPNRKEELKDA